jgi:hypothetical protein
MGSCHRFKVQVRTLCGMNDCLETVLAGADDDHKTVIRCGTSDGVLHAALALGYSPAAKLSTSNNIPPPKFVLGAVS